MVLQFVTHLTDQQGDPVPFRRCHLQRVAGEVGKETVFFHLFPPGGSLHQFRRPKENPSLSGYQFSVVFHASNLPRCHRNDGRTVGLIGPHSIGNALDKLVLDEQSIHAVQVQAPAEEPQFFITEDAYKRMKRGSVDISRIVIRIGYA